MFKTSTNNEMKGGGVPLATPTTIPPTMPAIMPANSGAPDARAIPKHKGSATKKTTILADKSYLRFLKRCFIRVRFKIVQQI